MDLDSGRMPDRRAASLLVVIAAVALAPSASAQVHEAEIVGDAARAAESLLGGSGLAPPSPDPVVPDARVAPAALAAGLLLAPLVTGGIRHIDRNNVLDHAARRRIYEYLWECGGANLRTLSDALELSSTNATWHLDKLLKAELVSEVQVNGGRMYYPRGAGRVARDVARARAVLSNDNARAVLDAVRSGSSGHQREIARVLGVNHGTVRWHLQRLEEAGLIRGRAEQERGFEPTPLADIACGRAPGPTGPLSEGARGNI